jgi:hypothetical protein
MTIFFIFSKDSYALMIFAFDAPTAMCRIISREALRFFFVRLKSKNFNPACVER